MAQIDGVTNVGNEDLSLVGLSIQVLGVAGIAVLFQLLNRAMPRDYFSLWSQAWVAMAAALVALRLALFYPQYLWPLELVYYLGEYYFAVLLARGFMLYPNRAARQAPTARWPWVLAVLWALLLARLPVEFSIRFGPHALLLSALLGIAWFRLRAVHLPEVDRWALVLAKTGVLLLALNFFCGGAIPLIAWTTGANLLADGYSAYQSIGDLLLEMLLAFGLVAIAAVDMRTTLERARIAMQGERDRMTMLAQQDALTGCFNRLALGELKSSLENRHGTVAMIDVDRLKPINDIHGHAIGDLAICHVANALKSELRPNDHVFRTGGDEFVLVAFDLPPGLALKRLQQAAKTLLTVELVPGHVGGLSISFGVADFNGCDDFDAALATADTAMYSHKVVSKLSAGDLSKETIKRS